MTLQTFIHWRSPIGMLDIVTRGNALCELKISNNKSEQLSTHTAQPVLRQLEEYFAGSRTSFEIEVEPEGTLFQRAVWSAIATIPYGETRTYAEVAAMIGRPKAARAVGQALNKNPVAIVVPCHRVVASGGKPGGFAWGNDCKQTLLAVEKRS